MPRLAPPQESAFVLVFEWVRTSAPFSPPAVGDGSALSSPTCTLSERLFLPPPKRLLLAAARAAQAYRKPLDLRFYGGNSLLLGPFLCKCDLPDVAPGEPRKQRRRPSCAPPGCRSLWMRILS
jgi:hypothetical protein